MKRVLVIVAILAAAAACGGAGSSAPTGGVPGQLNLSAGGTTAKQPVAQPAGAAVHDASGTTGSSVLPVQGPQVIRQAQLTITVGSGKFVEKLAAVRALVQAEQGYISGTDAQVNPAVNDQIRTGVISFMVPAAKFDQTIDSLTTLGTVQTEHISGNDVSAQYVDLQARLANEVAQRNAMLALLTKAQSVSDIIAVQTQLGEITGQIEQLKGQIQYIDQNTAFSAVSVDLVEAGVAIQTAPQDTWGFAAALGDAAHNFVTTINYVITGLGAIGPIVIVLGLGYLLWRRRGWSIPRRA